ncbi:MAG: DUF4962 domain-containing protein [Bryobacterales bacterium]|nr:DUF4962 domain-containing protein [Bryobacterales bacterium]
MRRTAAAGLCFLIRQILMWMNNRFPMLFLVMATLGVYAAAPPVSNRAPAPNDIGYLPADGARVGTNPPAMAWLPEPHADAYAVQLARDEGFQNGVITIRRTPYVLYTHTATLTPGTWWWRYACLDARGNQSEWSQARHFTIAGDAQPFPRPSGELVRERVPKSHPRLMLRPEEVGMFRQARLGPEKARWEELVKAAEVYLRAPLMPEPPPWTDGKWNAPEWKRNFQDTLRAVEKAETLAFCYLLSGDKRYGEGARKWLLHFASWNPAGSTSMDVNDEAGMPILYLTSRAYDWAYDALSKEDREVMRRMVRFRGEEAYDWLHDKPFEQQAYNSHGGRMWHFLGEAAIAYYGEVPEASKWLDYALTIFWGWYPSYGDEDGGWAQGYSYWASYVNRSTWWFDALRAGLLIDGTRKPFYRNVGLFPMYVAPPNGSLTGFGDFAEAEPDARAAVPVSYFARMRGVPEWQWFAEAWGRGNGETGPIGFIRSARPDPPKVTARPPSNWPQAKWFRGAGWVSLHSGMMNPTENVQVMMRAAPLGNISHSHADQNAIVLAAFGSPLLVNTGIRPWYGSPFSKEWYWTTKAHNALEIDGQGQPKTAEATGRIIVFQPGKEYDYVVGDATPGYGPNVERYRRHLLFLKPDVVVLVDEVSARKPVSLKFWLHGRAPFELNPAGDHVALAFGKASLSGFLRSPGGVRTVQTDKYPLPPEQGQTRPEWHLSSETKAKHTNARFVAVLGVGKAGEKIPLDAVEDASSGGRIAVQFRRAGKPVSISIDPAGPTVAVR